MQSLYLTAWYAIALQKWATVGIEAQVLPYCPFTHKETDTQMLVLLYTQFLYNYYGDVMIV